MNYLQKTLCKEALTVGEKIYLPQNNIPGGRTKKLNNRMRNQKPAVCVERARLVTESYKMTEGEPEILRRAKALAYILENMSIFIEEDELIVGHHASQLRWAPMYPEVCSFSEEELDLFPKRDVDRLQISDENKRYLLDEIYPYWEKKNLGHIAYHYFPDDMKKHLNSKYRVYNPISRTRSGYGHYTPNFEKILKEGFESVKKEAGMNLQKLSHEDIDYSEKMLFYKSIVIICDAVRVFSNRYSDLAKSLAEKEANPARKYELEKIAGVCAHVPFKPARSYHEALQSYWFTILIDYIFQNGSAISAGRFDQYIYPYYKNDLDNKIISPEDARELLEALFVQHMDIIKAGAYSTVRNNGGFATTIHLTLSGLDKKGNDATNDFTYLCIEADKNVFNSEPNVGVRVSSQCPDKVIEGVLKNLVHHEGGKYPIFNDDAIIPALMDDGVESTDALDYSVVGCVEPTPSGNTLGLTNASFFNVAKCLELALNDGKCMISGEQLGPHTGTVDSFTTMNDVFKAFEGQLNYFAGQMALSLNIIVKAIARYTPHIYCSAVTDGCIESGKDIAAGGAKYNYVGVQGVGIADVADSLNVINKVVFEQGKISLKDFVKILKEDFAGNEVLRQYCINHVSKYGNDDDEADKYASYVAEQYCLAVKKYKDPRAGKYRAGLYCLSSNTPLGRQVAALPSGRKAFTPLADGGVSPKHGMDLLGPTAACCSVAKIPHKLATNGTNYNQKYTAALLQEPQNLKKLVQIIRTYFQKGGFQIQFNILSPETLKKAQQDPETYRGLVVRVAGYSAFFVELDRDIQNEIISRTEHTTI